MNITGRGGQHQSTKDELKEMRRITSQRRSIDLLVEGENDKVINDMETLQAEVQ